MSFLGRPINNGETTIWDGSKFITGSIQSQVSGTWIEGSPSPRIRTSASVAIGSGTSFAQQFGSNIFFYVSGSRAGTTGISVFGGDLLVSGALDVRSAMVVTGTLMGSNIISGAVGVSSPWFTGSLVNLQNGKSYILAGSGVTTATGSDGQVTISLDAATLANMNEWIDGGNKLRTTASVAIGAGVVFASDIGSNVVFYVSGTVSSSGSSAVLPSTTMSGTFTMGAGLIEKVTVITGNYTILPTDSIIAVSTSTALTVTLPTTPEFGRAYFIKDIKGSASTANITVSSSVHLIDGTSTYVFAVNYESIKTVFYGGTTHWGVT